MKMDYKKILERSKTMIIRDIQGDIIENFKSKRYITEVEFDEIDGLNVQEDKNKAFYKKLHARINESMYNELLTMLRIDYYWIANSLRNDEETVRKASDGQEREITDIYSAESEETVADCLRKGNVPLHLYGDASVRVSRKNIRENLIEQCKSLKRGEYLLLYGMNGSGKSCLAMDVLHDVDLMTNHLKGHAFWLPRADNIQQTQSQLWSYLSTKNDEVDPAGSNLCDPSIARDHLRKMFNRDEFKDGLVVLDGVDPKSINYLDIYCKTLIISHDKSIVADYPTEGVKYFEMDLCFTQQESLNLLSQAAGLMLSDFSSYIGYARQMHDLSRGFPFTMAWLAGIIRKQKHEAASKKDLWEELVNLLTSDRKPPKDATKKISLSEKRYSSVYKDPLYSVLDHQMNELPEDLRFFYEQFAVFSRDVNIQDKVLMVLWSLDRLSVNQILNKLIDKSLVAKKWNPHLKIYVYGIHDVLLGYLSKRNENTIKYLHTNLIQKYSDKCDGEFWKLEDDNYIYLYLAHHLEKAGRFDVFKVFVNLEFVEAKVRAVGATDLLNDFRKYRDHITVGGNGHMLAELECFIKSFGQFLQLKDIDIVQLGLQQAENSLIHQAAKELALKRRGSVYLNFLLKQSCDSVIGEDLVNITEEGGTTACFADIPSNIFVATQNGDINLLAWGNGERRIMKVLQGHKSRVVYLTTSFDKRFLLSIDEGREFRIWTIVDVADATPASYGFGSRDPTPSPPLRQKSYLPVFSTTARQQNCKSILKDINRHPFSCVQFSPDSERILACFEDRAIAMMAFEGVKARKTVSSVPRACAFSLDGEYTFIGCDSGLLIILDRMFFEVKTIRFQQGAIKDLHSVSGVNGTYSGSQDSYILVVIRSGLVEVLRFKHFYDPPETLYSWNLTRSQGEVDYVMRSCVAKNGSYIAITTSNHSVSIFNLANGNLQRKYETSGKMLGLDAFIDQANSKNYLLAITDNRTVSIWDIKLSPQELASKFSAVPRWSSDSPLIAVPGINHLKILEGCNLDRKIETDEKVLACHINKEGTHVAFGTDSGSVSLYNRSTDELKKSIMKFKDSVESPTLVNFVRVFLVNGEPLVIGKDDMNTIKVHYGQNRMVMEFKAEREVISCFFLPERKQILTLEINQDIKLWTTSMKQTDEDFEFEAESGEACVQCCDLGGKSLLAIANNKKNLRLINFGKDVTHKLTNLESLPICCCFSPDGSYLAVGLRDGTLTIYDAENVEMKLRVQINSRQASSFKAVCLGNGASVFGALVSKRIYIGRISDDFGKVAYGCTVLSAEQIIKNEDGDSFLSIDDKSRIQIIKFFNDPADLEPKSPEKLKLNMLK